MLKKKSLKTLIFFMTVAIVSAVFACGFTGGVAFAAELPTSYTTQWFDTADYLDTAASVALVGQMMDGMSAEEKADLKANPIVVAVIDTGITIGHEVFDGIIYSNSGEIAGNGIDDDNNGYIDDVNGWDFVDKDSNPTDVTNNDKDSHGTHVCGIVAREIIVYGLQDYVKILPIRAGNSTGSFSLANTVAAVDYARIMGADVINLSFKSWQTNSGWGSNGTLDRTLQSAYNDGSVIVAAAGNDGAISGLTSSTASPAALDNVIGVMGYDQEGGLYVKSNYGPAYDVVAPAVKIRSSVRPTYQQQFSGNDEYIVSDGGSGYALKNGTSMASPLVSFMAAVMMIRYGRNADVVTYAFENYQTNSQVEGYEMARLSDYFDYTPIMSLTLSHSTGTLAQQIINPQKVSFTVDLKYYGTVGNAPYTDAVYNDVTIAVQKCDASGNVLNTDYVFSGNGYAFEFTPSAAGYYKVSASVGDGKIVSNAIIVNVGYASVEDDVLSVVGDTVIRADSDNLYTVKNFDMLNPVNNTVIWFVYKVGELYGTPVVGSTMNFVPTETGDYKIVCRLETNGATTTLQELTVEVKMSKENADKTIGGVVSGVLLAACAAFLVLACVQQFAKKKNQ